MKPQATTPRTKTGGTSSLSDSAEEQYSSSAEQQQIVATEHSPLLPLRLSSHRKPSPSSSSNTTLSSTASTAATSIDDETDDLLCHGERGDEDEDDNDFRISRNVKGNDNRNGGSDPPLEKWAWHGSVHLRRRPQSQQHRQHLRWILLRRMFWGGCLGGLVALAAAASLLLLQRRRPPAGGRPMTYTASPSDAACPAVRGHRRRPGWGDEIRAYLDLFGGSVSSDKSLEENASGSTPATRRLDSVSSGLTGTGTSSGGGSSSSSSFSSSSTSRNDPTLVIAGKMTVVDGPCNIAQYDLKTREWSLNERIQLSLYNSYSGGEVYSLLANHTPLVPTVAGGVGTAGTSTSESSSSSSSSSLSSARGTFLATTSVNADNAAAFFGGLGGGGGGLLGNRPVQSEGGASSASSSSSSTLGSDGGADTITRYTGSGELLVVGAFDTTYRNSQVTYCSVGMWDGSQLSKVGEGLCNSALSKGMKITTAALAGPHDVYVAGSFQTQVWNGDRHEFVKIYNIAHFNAIDQVWLPLNVGQITCSWCTVTVLALAWDSKRRQLHVAGKFNAIDGRNVPAGLAIYDYDSGHLVAHPGGGLSMRNSTQDGVGTALQLDQETGVLYVMGSFERLTATYEICLGLAAYEIEADRWTCLADAAHTVLPTGGGNMLLTPYGLMVAGKTAPDTTWPDPERPYTVALLKATLKTRQTDQEEEERYHSFNWSWLPGFQGHEEPLHALANGFGTYQGFVFIAGDNLVAMWGYQPPKADDEHSTGSAPRAVIGVADGKTVHPPAPPELVPTTEDLTGGKVRGAIMAISQMMPEPENPQPKQPSGSVNITIIVYCVSIGCVIGVIGAILCNKNISSALFPFLSQEKEFKGFTLDTLTYSAVENSTITEAYHRAMKMRFVSHPHLLTIIDPQEIFLQRIIGEGTFGRVWSAKWRSSSVAVKEFVFAQAAVAGRSSMTQEIVEEIIGEAGMMAILRHPNVLQLFGCSLTAQAIWIVSELCSLGSLRQLLDDNDRVLPVEQRLSIALQVAEGMTYLHTQQPPIIHRDLKSHNIFVHETFTDSEDASTTSEKKLRSPNEPYEKLETHSTMVAKIGDWGSARATLSGSRTMTHGVGTACWLAPEVIKHARSSKFSDVYGYGIVLWELATREEVYQGLETTQIIAKVANENLRPPVPQDCPWKDIMVKCWAENPLDRLEFSDIVRELNVLVKQRQILNGSIDEENSLAEGGGENEES